MPAGQNFTPGQDHKPQAFNFSHRQEQANQGPKGAVTESQANKIKQSGGTLLISKKQNPVNANQGHSGAGARARALDDDNESTKVKTVSHDVRLEIIRARAAKGWTQAQLAQQISERASVVTDYENGKAVPNEGVLVKMEKAFGIHLRGKMAGQPIAPKQFKAGGK